MAFTETEVKMIRSKMEEFLKENRPPEDLRDKLDLSWRITGQSIDIFEIRPSFFKPEEKFEDEIARITYVRNKDHWKLFWMMSDMKWHGYDPRPVVPTLSEALLEVKNDSDGCFFG
jgi:hypothetical protein